MNNQVAQVRFLQVVEVNSTRGFGVENDPVRRITEYFDMDGKFIFGIDPWKDAVTTKEGE